MFAPMTIRVNIFTNFLILIGLITLSLLGLQYYFSHELASSAAYQNFMQDSQKITSHLRSLDENAKNMLNFSQYYQDLELAVEDSKTEKTIRRFVSNIDQMPNIYALYAGHSNGDLLGVVNMKSASGLHAHYHAPEYTRWTVMRIFDTPKGRVERFEYLNDQLMLLGQRETPSDFNATNRPWFMGALRSDKAIRTDPYTFASHDEKGITFAKSINTGEGVLAIDVTLERLNTLLHEQSGDSSNEIVMFGSDEMIFASSQSVRADRLDMFMTKASRSGMVDKIMRFKEGDKEKFVMVTPLSNELGKETYLGMSIDVDRMLAPYLEKIFLSLWITLGFLIATIPFVYLTSSRITKPIKALMEENEKIKERRFDEVRRINTNIIELIDLSDSLVSMSQSIQEYQKAQAELMDSFIKLLADTIDAKSPYTGGHCRRVPQIAVMLAQEAEKSQTGSLKSFKFESEESRREFEMGAWLHDCGKVTTPEYVVDKATKLETIYNRIHEVRTRFEVIWRDIEIEACERHLGGEEMGAVTLWKNEEQGRLREEFAFVAECNIGGEYMSSQKQEHLKQIAGRRWVRHLSDRLGLSDAELLRYEGSEEMPLPASEALLDNRPEHKIKRVDFDQEAYAGHGFKLEVPEYLYDLGEIYNLCIEKGTLSPEERFKIQEHVIMTIKMLELLPYPDNMKRIPEYAGTHHETLIGTGYPRGLSAAELSIPARIMVIADIFEALSASDRPYKKGKTLSEALKIMNQMRKDQHIDAELFELFLRSGVSMKYALEYLRPEQIDEVDIKALLGS